MIEDGGRDGDGSDMMIGETPEDPGYPRRTIGGAICPCSIRESFEPQGLIIVSASEGIKVISHPALKDESSRTTGIPGARDDVGNT